MHTGHKFGPLSRGWHSSAFVLPYSRTKFETLAGKNKNRVAKAWRFAKGYDRPPITHGFGQVNKTCINLKSGDIYVVVCRFSRPCDVCLAHTSEIIRCRECKIWKFWSNYEAGQRARDSPCQAQIWRVQNENRFPKILRYELEASMKGLCVWNLLKSNLVKGKYFILRVISCNPLFEAEAFDAHAHHDTCMIWICLRFWQYISHLIHIGYSISMSDHAASRLGPIWVMVDGWKDRCENCCGLFFKTVCVPLSSH